MKITHALVVKLVDT